VAVEGVAEPEQAASAIKIGAMKKRTMAFVGGTLRRSIRRQPRLSWLKPGITVTRLLNNVSHRRRGVDTVVETISGGNRESAGSALISLLYSFRILSE